MSSSKLRQCSALAATLLLAACGDRSGPPEEARVVRTLTVGSDDATTETTFSGEVTARYESEVGFRVSGRVTERLVDSGQRVERGQLLMRLDASDATLSYSSARAQLDAARSQLAQAQLDFERVQGLHAKHFASQAELDREKVELDSARSQLTAAEADFGLARNQRNYTELTAPHAGVVTGIHVEVGEVVATGQPAVGIAADGEREVAISVPESRLPEVRDARGMRVSLWARPGVWYTGNLRELAAITDGETRQYTAKVTIAQSDSNVELGMTARVLIASAARANAYRLPLTAIYDKDGHSFVWLVDASSSRARIRAVELADVDEDAAFVTRGIAAGDVVVTAGVHLLFEGQKVRGAASPGAAQEG